MTALWASNHLALTCRLGTASAACHPGVGFTEFESALGTLDNVFEFRYHRVFFWNQFIKISE